MSPARCAGSSFTCAERSATLALHMVIRDTFNRRLQTLGQHGSAVHAGVFFGHGGDQGLGNGQGPAHIAQSTARAVGRDHGGNGSAGAAVFGVDVLDHLFAALVLKVHVNVGRLVALARDKALEQHTAARRIHLGHAQAVTHCRIGGRPPALAQDAPAAGKAHDVMHRQKIHLVFQLRNQGQLVLHLGAHARRHACGVAQHGTLFGVLAQGLRRCVAGQHGFERVLVAQALQRKMAALRHHQGVGHMLCVKQVTQTCAAAQMALGIGLQTPPALRNRQAQAHGSEHVVQRLARAQVHAHPAGGHDGQAGQARNLRQAQGVQSVLHPQAARTAQPHGRAVVRFG